MPSISFVDPSFDNCKSVVYTFCQRFDEEPKSSPLSLDGTKLLYDMVFPPTAATENAHCPVLSKNPIRLLLFAYRVPLIVVSVNKLTEELLEFP